MSAAQGFVFAIVLGMMAHFVCGLIRYDLVALIVLAAAVAKSGVTDVLIRRVADRLGLPLSILVVVVGVPMIAMVWPF